MRLPSVPISPDRVQSQLLWLAGIFLGLYSLALTLSPAARARSWGVALRWDHWLGYLVWCLIVLLANLQLKRRLPARSPDLFPLAALLSGLGLLTIWRLLPGFGLRQMVWLAAGGVSLAVGLRLPDPLGILRRYKYLWLSSGILLTGLTLILGTNPGDDSGPRLWLGCCGVYFQPSEPLKLLLVVYLAAYFADRSPWLSASDAGMGAGTRRPLLLLLAPTAVMTGLTLLLLLAQRDLGTAMIFISLYIVIAYLATGRLELVALGGAFLSLAGLAGYYLFDVVRLRIDAWLNPWQDPSGRSYQIVQSLLALANGGLGGRGPGLGNPGLVPIAHSDFVYTALIEEGGLVWAVAVIGVLAMLAAAGLRIALQAPDRFRRYLAAGLTAYLVGQSILIVGGNVRLLPLTGVTLPFVSYGGSSLLTAFLSLLILLLISQGSNTAPALAPNPRQYLSLGGLIFGGLAALALVTGWWTAYRGPILLARTDNPRRAISDRFVPRGGILDRGSTPLAVTVGEAGELARRYDYLDLAPLIGYNDPVYGQAGLEASLDPILRGMRGNPALTVWWHHLLYGQPPPGLDVRLGIDLDLQRAADELLGDQTGAIVLLNARSGEVLAISSHPGYDPNRLAEDWEQLIADPRTPLIDRAAQGSYQAGTALGPFLLAAARAQGVLPDLPAGGALSRTDCAGELAEDTWGEAIRAGCPGAALALAESLGEEAAMGLLENLGFFTTLGLEPGFQGTPVEPGFADPGEAISGQADLRVSPVQLALAAAALSGDGARPALRLAMSVDLPETGWMVLPPAGEAKQVYQPSAVDPAVESLRHPDLPVWESLAVAGGEEKGIVSWYLAGTLPAWTGTPLALVVALEAGDPQLAQAIGQELMRRALQGE
jgi:cell division protein FtsW (lipid II flippase)